MVITHAIIEKLHFLVSGMPYNVRLVRSVVGGKTFWYCGFGCFCKTKEEAEKYIKNCQEEIEQVIDTTNLLDGKEGD